MLKSIKFITLRVWENAARLFFNVSNVMLATLVKIFVGFYTSVFAEAFTYPTHASEY